MKITAVEPLVLGTSWRNLIFLKVKTDEGLVGIGECTVQNREEGMLGYIQGAARRHVIGYGGAIDMQMDRAHAATC